MSNQVMQSIDIVLNGKAATVKVHTSIADFLVSKGLQDRLVVVEVNGVIVPRAEFAAVQLSAGDRVEVVHFVGGG